MQISRGFKSNLTAVSIALCASIAPAASAGVINFNMCTTNCDVLDVNFLQEFTSVASLTFQDNDMGGVNFVLTNTFDDFDATQDRAFLSRLFLDLDAAPAGSANESSNIDDILIGADSFSVDGSIFDVKIDFVRDGARISDRLVAGEFASWTLAGISEQNVVADGIVLAQRIRTDSGFGASRILGQVVSQQVQSVPEPGVLALLLMGGLGIYRGRRKTARHLVSSV